VAVEGDVVVCAGVVTGVPRGLILASVGLVHPAKSTHARITTVAARNTVHFMKDVYVFFTFLICVFSVRAISICPEIQDFSGYSQTRPACHRICFGSSCFMDHQQYIWQEVDSDLPVCP
jgi:hypothetical protein